MRPLQSRRDTKTAEAAFIRAVTKRDGYECQARRPLSAMYTAPYEGFNYQQCKNRATDTAHIVPRRLCGKAKFDPDVGIRMCRRCHDCFDDRSYDYKVVLPKSIFNRALDAVNKVAKQKIKLAKQKAVYV